MTVDERSGPRGQRVRVGLLGMYASANLGDTAIQTAMMRALQVRLPAAEFVAICTDPADAAKTFDLPARHVSGFGGEFRKGSAGHGPEPRGPLPLQLAEAYRHIRRLMTELDVLLVSGSGQIDDFWGGPWEQPFRLLAWASAARAQGKPVAFFGVGVDQLTTKTGTWLALAAMKRAQLRVLRDPGSLRALQELRFPEPCDVCPDPAFHLDTGHLGAPPASDGPPFVVLSPIARNAWPGPHDATFEKYLAALAAAADHLQGRGYEVRFVCSQTRMDPPVIAKVQAAMRGDASATRVHTPSSVDGYLRAVQGAHLVLASRLHALILALVMGTPVVAISYARKVEQQMQDAALGEYCLDLPAVDSPALIAALEHLLARHGEVKAHVGATAARFRRELDARFDRLASLFGAGPA